MSRHRIVRSMNYSDEYDGYDDVYGHSVEDDYSMSPSDAAFMYDRDSRQPAQFSAFLTTEEDIQEEEDEAGGAGAGGRKDSFVKPALTDLDEARLRSCRDEVQSVVGDSLPDSTLDETILRCDFDVARTLDALLQSPKSKSVDLETSASKTKPAAKLDGKDDFNIMSSDCDKIGNNLSKVVGQTKRMSTADQIKVSVALRSNRDESKGNIVNRTMIPASRASGFSSLKALKMKHKQASATEKSNEMKKARNVEELVDKVVIVDCTPVVTESKKSKSREIVEVENVGVESAPGSRDVIDEKLVEKGGTLRSTVSNSEVEPASTVDAGKMSSEYKPRSVCTPGRTSSLAALAKRCRNPSERRSFSEQKPVLQNSSAAAKISDQIVSDSLPLEFDKLSVVQNDDIKSANKIDETIKGNKFVIDLMAALRSPSDETKQAALDESDSVVEPLSNVHIEDVRANIFINCVMVKSEFQTVSCSPFGEIICKTFAYDCKEFVCTPEVIDSTIERFAFDVLSPDDEIRKLRKNWWS